MRRLFLILCLLFPVSALARTASYNAQNFKPTADAGYYLGVYGTELLDPGDFSLGAAVDYAHQPIGLQIVGGGSRDVVGKELLLNLTGAYGVLDWIDIGMLVATAPYIEFFPTATTSDTRIRMGDISLNARFRLIDHEEYPVGVAFVPQLTLPTGDGESFVGNNQFTGGGTIVVDSERFDDRFSVALNLGFEVRESALVSTQTSVGHLFLYGLAGNFSLLPDLDLLAELRGLTTVSDPSVLHPLEAEGGARWFVTDRWAITGAVGGSLIDGIGSPLFRIIAGVAWVPEHWGFGR